ncbi:MAG: SMC-Scp complex subunit ScpB [Alphaproteobacteria bacterium]|nr:SMC-Scp complex subunit ScpB [Alphaproteobacteria bacterium]
MIEALLFAATEPLDENSLIKRLPENAEVPALLEALAEEYEGRGVNLVQRAGKWMLQTAPDLAFLLRHEVEEEKKLSRAAVETLAIIAYHQPVTRAEIEEVRGVAVSKGTLDVLMETGWIRPKGKRQSPGRPVTYGVTDEFLIHFGLETIKDLPGLHELKAAGLLDAEIPPEFESENEGDDDEDDEDEDDNVLVELPLEDERSREH